MSDKFVVTCAAFRFYEDGSESGSSPVADQDTNVTGRNVDSDSQIHLRLRHDETGAGSIDGATTDDYALQYRLNGGGGWQSLTTSTEFVQADSASTLVDGVASTNRATNGISDGGGSFIAGKQEETNGIIDYQLTANNFTEHVFALLLISADLADGDFVEFRCQLNGGNPGMTNTFVPRITVTKTAADVLQAQIVM